MARVLRQIDAEALVDGLEVVRQREDETELAGDIELSVGNDRVGDFLFVAEALRDVRRLGGEDDDLAADCSYVRIYFLQSIQLCAAVGSPMSSKER